MTYFNMGLKAILITSSIALGANILAMDNGSKSSESQAKNATNNSSTLSKMASDRTSTSQRVEFEAKGLTKESKAATETRKQRPEERSNKSSSTNFSIADAYVDLLFDEDLDGYYSEFRVNFDADTNF